jgi:hypothetical protein
MYQQIPACGSAHHKPGHRDNKIIERLERWQQKRRLVVTVGHFDPPLANCLSGITLPGAALFPPIFSYPPTYVGNNVS